MPVDTLHYDAATGCRKSMTKGAMALVSWLRRNAAAPTGAACAASAQRLGLLDHAEGRAVDWHLDVPDPAIGVRRSA